VSSVDKSPDLTLGYVAIEKRGRVMSHDILIQVFSDLLKGSIKAFTEHNGIAVLLDESIFAEIVLVDRT
jgi:hypothetical protein